MISAATSTASLMMQPMMMQPMTMRPAKLIQRHSHVRSSATAMSDEPPSTRSAKLISDLRAGDFQHPDDKRASEALSLLAPLEWGMRQAFSALVEDAVFLD